MLLVNAVNTEGRPLEIFVKDGRIAAVGQELEALAGENETVIDAGGLTVLPAFVDLHCHWRTPGFEYKEDIETGSRAAAAGGYTFVNLMPNTKPVCSSAAQAFMVEQKAAEVGLCDVNQTVSITENFDGVSIDHPACRCEVHHRGRPRRAGQCHHGKGFRHLHPEGYHRDEPRRGYGDQPVGLPSG